jgi:hypothetical protein
MTDKPHISQTKAMSKEVVSHSHDIHVTKKQKNGNFTMKMTNIQARNFMGKWYLEWLYFDEDPVKFG